MNTSSDGNCFLISPIRASIRHCHLPRPGFLLQQLVADDLIEDPSVDLVALVGRHGSAGASLQVLDELLELLQGDALAVDAGEHRGQLRGHRPGGLRSRIRRGFLRRRRRFRAAGNGQYDKQRGHSQHGNS
jgi:hypothetical protein